jgi:hypothetical protein
MGLHDFAQIILRHLQTISEYRGFSGICCEPNISQPEGLECEKESDKRILECSNDGLQGQFLRPEA